MFDKLNDMRKAMEEMKNRLDQVVVNGSADGSRVKVEMSAGMEVRSVHLDRELLHPENQEEAEALLTAAFNNAIEAARGAAAGEMKSGMLPNIPGLF